VKARAAVVVALTLVLVGGACNNPTYNRDTIEHDLERETKLTASQATCLAQRLEQTIGEQRLGARDLPTAHEREKLHAAVVFAIVACSGAPYDRARVVHALEREARMPSDQAPCLVREIERRVPPRRLAAPGNLANPARTTILSAIADATITCSDNPAHDLRNNVGLARTQAACVMRPNPPPANGAPLDRRAVFVKCTTSPSPTSTSSTSTTTAVPAIPTPTPPPSS
jgi:hypothetical protein